MHFHGRVSQSNEQASQTANLHIPACNLRCFVVVCISRNAVFHFKKSCNFALQMIIYCNYTTICRKVQACTFFLGWKKNFQRYHSRYKILFSWISEFFRKERTVFHLSISTTEHHFHVETPNFFEKRNLIYHKTAIYQAFSHSFRVHIFNWWRRCLQW